jgi:hypothetical protein
LRACCATQALFGFAVQGDEFDPAAFERDEEEHVDPFQPSRLGREEIAGGRRRRVLAEEVSP